MSAVSDNWLLRELDDEIAEQQHRSENEEFLFYQSVIDGDIDAVRENCEKRRFLDLEGVGTLSRNPLTNMKYHFVVGVSIIARLCIIHGLEMEQSFRMSDFFIQKLDYINSIEEINELHNRMSLEYTGKMRLLQKNAGTSRPVTESIDYIYGHIKERITIEDLSEYTGVSVSYLSKLFKKEVGMSLSDYIREKKIEKAQNLLRYSDYSMIDIANHLAFSSQSHFIQQFKAITGVTPKQYRDHNRQTLWEVSSHK